MKIGINIWANEPITKKRKEKTIYVPLENEIFKKINGSNYHVSNFGNVINQHSQLVSKSFFATNKNFKKFWMVRIVIDEKTKTKPVHILMLNTFKKDEWLPQFNHNAIIGNKKIGRISKAKACKSQYNITKTGKGLFVDGNVNNLNIENLKWKFDNTKGRYSYQTKSKQKYANVFYNTDILIAQITKNTNDKNKNDNEIIIEFLKGNEQIIWNLFIKYKDDYKSKLKSFINKNRQKTLIKRKESHLELDDFIIDAQMKMINKIKKGRFDGRRFKQWSCKVIEKFLVQYFVIQERKLLQDETKTFFN